MSTLARIVVATALVLPFFGSVARADGPLLIYVDEVQSKDAALKSDVGALTTALCTGISKDKRVEVLCAPDVKQILGFAATAALVGSANPAVDNLQQRLDRVDYVVNAAAKKEGNVIVLQLRAGPKAPDASATAMYSQSPTVSIDDKAATTKELADKSGSWTARIVNGLIGPATPPPPEPLPPATPKAKATPKK